MRILVIDSHKGTDTEVPTNLHWTNAKQIADHLGADLIWSIPSVNDKIKREYDKIIFVHASPYCQVDKAWLLESPRADLFYVTNEYNLGEPRILWRPAKEGRHYTVIANHDPDISKIVKKYTKDWKKINLNALSFSPKSITTEDMFGDTRQGIVYYGSYRKGREPSFRRYLTGRVMVSTHPKNVDRFKFIGVPGPFIGRIDWPGGFLNNFKASLYIEDEVTHRSYNYLANRFYEALSYHVPIIFDAACENTIEKSSYIVPDELIVSDVEDLHDDLSIPDEWYYNAAKEKWDTLQQIKEIINE